METVFFSWQSDRDSTCGRDFLDAALDKAVSELNSELKLVSAERGLSVDRDTKGVAGTPHIVDTILKKIDACRVFVADLTFVGQRVAGKATSNPNVLIEYGWALKSKGTGAFIGVMNVAHGEPGESNLPFDLRHLLHPFTYNLPDGATDDQRRAAKDELVPHLKRAIAAILLSGSEGSQGGRTLFQPKVAADSKGRLVTAENAWGVSEDTWLSSHREIRLSPGPVTWLRLYPKFFNAESSSPLSKRRMSEIIRSTERNKSIDPLIVGSQQGFIRDADRVGICVYTSETDETPGLAVLMENGELWAADTYSAEEDEPGVRYLPERQFFELLEKFITVYRDVLKIPLPWIWEAGVEGLKGKRLLPWGPPNAFKKRPTGISLNDSVVCRGEISSIDARPQDVLRPFVEAVYDAFNSRPAEGMFG
jgi:hypothetical protein